MKKKWYIIMLFIFFCLFENVFALEVDKFTITTENKVKAQTDLGSEGLNTYYPYKSTLYEFIDELGNYNILFEIYNDDNYMGWIKLDSNFKVISEIKIDKKLEIFGNALYEDGYLYVVTGRNDLTELPSGATASSYPTDYTDAIVLSVAKYDSTGKLIKNLDISGRETSHVVAKIVADGTKNLSHLEYGARNPFRSGNCDLAINDGVLVVFYSKKMYNGHQMSDLMMIDTNTLDYLTRPTTMEAKNKFAGIRGGNARKWVSHSFDQRVIITSDGQYLFVDQGDAFSSRGFAVTKTYQGTYRLSLKEFYPFHFRESANEPYGYNDTFANLGNIIEVDDGYILVASSEKTLSINYANSRGANESRNLFIQKYKKDFENQTSETLNVFNTTVRKSETSRTSTAGLGELFLSEKGETDYGVKWLTNYTNNKTILGSRAIKIENNKIAILWAEQDIKANGSSFSLTGARRYYYEIIDSNGNLIQEPVEITNANLSNVIHYNFDGYNIYWTQEGKNNNELIVYRLNVKEEEPKTEVSLNKTSMKLLVGKSETLKATTNPSTNNLSWTSSNPNVATVDKNGFVVAKESGVTIITVTTPDGETAHCEVKVVNSILGDSNQDGVVDIKDVFKAIKVQFVKINNNIQNIDFNKNGYIDIVDIFNIFYKFLFSE